VLNELHVDILDYIESISVQAGCADLEQGNTVTEKTCTSNDGRRHHICSTFPWHFEVLLSHLRFV